MPLAGTLQLISSAFLRRLFPMLRTPYWYWRFTNHAQRWRGAFL